MSELRFSTRGVRAGSAAQASEQETQQAGRPGKMQIQAGSAARQAEELKRSGATQQRGTAFSLRAQGGSIRRTSEPALHATATPTVYEEGETVTPVSRDRLPLDRPIMPAPVEAAPLPRPAEANPGDSSPGLLHTAAAQLQSRIRALFSKGKSA